MKIVMVGAAACGLLIGAVLAQEPQAAPKAAAPAEAKLETNRDKASYGLGLSIGRNLKAQSVDVSLDLMARGLADGLSGSPPLLTDAQIQQALQAFQQELQTRASEKGKKEGTDYLAANAKKEGVKTLPSGLQYKVLKEGTGPMPKAADRVKVNYRGTLIDGTEFDSSYKRGEPATFGVSDVIKGWTEALQLMKVGSRWQLAIPAELAYGANPPPGLPPNATLLFEVELLGIEK